MHSPFSHIQPVFFPDLGSSMYLKVKGVLLRTQNKTKPKTYFEKLAGLRLLNFKLMDRL